MKCISYSIISMVVLSLVSVSCSSKDDDEQTKNNVQTQIDERPTWTVVVPAEASVNMMAWVQIPIDMVISDDDIIAAFVGNDCRAIGIKSSDRTFVLTIKGEADEHSPLTLKYYNAANRRIYTDGGHLYFVADKPVGLEEPYVLSVN